MQISAMNEFQGSLDALLHRYFHITEIHTNRQDQWYKRSLQRWMKVRGSRNPLILAPKEPRSEWAPELARLSAQLAEQIREAAAEERGRQKKLDTPSKDKLFPDSALDGPLFGWIYSHWKQQPLTPRMQRVEFWTTATEMERADAAKALLETRQLAALLYLASMPSVDMKRLSSVTDQRWYSIIRRNGGWQGLIEQLLNFVFFLGIMCSLQGDLTAERQYLYWVPFASEYFSYLSDGANAGTHYLGLFERQVNDDRPIPSIKDMHKYKEWCLQVLASISVLSEECQLLPVDWESRVTRAALYFFGFEAWNRSREGQGYLRCDRNRTKDAKWLSEHLSEEDLQVLNESTSDSQTPTIPKVSDPLRLRDPKKEPEPEQMDSEQADQLAALEGQEVAYGVKRSEKYRTKH